MRVGAAAPLADLNPNPLALNDDECALSERSASTTTAAVAQLQTMAGFMVGSGLRWVGAFAGDACFAALPTRNKIMK